MSLSFWLQYALVKVCFGWICCPLSFWHGISVCLQRFESFGSIFSWKLFFSIFPLYPVPMMQRCFHLMVSRVFPRASSSLYNVFKFLSDQVTSERTSVLKSWDVFFRLIWSFLWVFHVTDRSVYSQAFSLVLSVLCPGWTLPELPFLFPILFVSHWVSSGLLLSFVSVVVLLLPVCLFVGIL